MTILLLAALVCLAASLPFKSQIALLNSLEVGREEAPMEWTCAGCDEDTKPINSHVIEEKAVKIRAILSVYEEYTVLSFRYTANLKNVWQDLLYPIQVDLLPLSVRMTMLLRDAKFKENTTTCGRASETMSSATSGTVTAPRDSSSPESVLEEDLPVSATLTLRPQGCSLASKSLPSVVPESATRSGPSTLTHLWSTPGSTSVGTPLLSSPAALLPFATTSTLETQWFATTTRNSARPSTPKTPRKSSVTATWSLNLRSILPKFKKETSMVFWTTSSVTRRSEISPLSFDLPQFLIPKTTSTSTSLTVCNSVRILFGMALGCNWSRG